MKVKKQILFVLALVLLLTGVWLYKTVTFSFGKALPEENWTKAQLWWYNDEFVSEEITIDEAALPQLLTVAKQVRISHRESFWSISQPHFRLLLYHGSGYPTSVTVVANGDIAVAAELDTDHYRHYDDGEELYGYLYDLYVHTINPA